MATWYWNGATDSDWGNLLNWWDNEEASGTVHPDTVPWGTIDTAQDDLMSCLTVVNAPTVYTNSLGDGGARLIGEPVERWRITGTCDIDQIDIATSVFDGIFTGNGIFTHDSAEEGPGFGQISGGTFSGDNFVNNGMIWGGSFTGDNFVNNYYVYGGSFTGSNVSNSLNIYGGAFTGPSFINGYSPASIYGGVFSCESFQAFGDIFGGIFACSSFTTTFGPYGGFWLDKGSVKLTDWAGTLFIIKGVSYQAVKYTPTNGGLILIEGTDLLGAGML